MAGTVRISPDELVEFLAKLAKNENLQVSVKQSAKGGLTAGVCATVGGLVGGPAGIAVGAAVGGLVGAYAASGTFKPVYQVLQELSSVEKEKLRSSVMAAIGDAGVLDFASLAALIATDQMYKKQMLGAMLEYLKGELGMDFVE